MLEMMRTLFKGLEEEFCALADKCDEMDHMYTLRMLVKIEQLQEEHKGACVYAESILAQLRSRLQTLFNEFTKEQLTWIEGFKSSTKRAGILGPFARLPRFIERMEAAASCGRTRCATADETYTRLIDCMLGWLPQIANQEPKYANLVLMENAHFFWRALSEFSHIPCLAQYQRKAYDMYKENRDLYVSWSVKYEFPKVFEFFALLESTAANLSSPRDVPFTPGLSKQDLRALCKTHLVKKKVQKQVNAMMQRVVKHLGDKNVLLPYVWTCMNEYFITSFKRFETLVAQCKLLSCRIMTAADSALYKVTKLKK